MMEASVNELLVLHSSQPMLFQIECSQFLESTAEQTTHGYPTLAHRLWLEAGKHRPQKPSRPDPQFNNNVWRNFKQTYGFETEKGKSSIISLTAKKNHNRRKTNLINLHN